jgi:Uma2 family endonuclease
MSSLGRHAKIELPAVDEHIVVPERGYEIDDGEVVLVSPSLEPHADRHSKLSWLLESHKAAEFNVASDMLTRISETTDRAPDASVYPRARDPQTGGRQLEHLAFEVVSTESLADAGEKAAGLVGRGVRRVFAIDVKRMRVLEWSAERGTWKALDGDASISDPALVTPLPVQALLREAKADDAVGQALLIRGNRVIEAALQAREEEGAVKALAQAVLGVLAARGLQLSDREQEQLLGERDPERLHRWVVRAATCESTAELFALHPDGDRQLR